MPNCTFLSGRRHLETLGGYMSLATYAVALPPLTGVPPITCHVATWYWAAQAAQAAGLSEKKTPVEILNNICAMPVPAQPAMLALRQSGKWDFNITPMTPPVGCVLFWPNAGTHSAVVTNLNRISGYNQPAQFPHLAGQIGYTTASPAQLAATCSQCIVISEGIIIAKAAALKL